MSDLTGALPQTVDAYAAMASYLAQNGITVGIADFGGVRTEADTVTILADRLQDYNSDHGVSPLDTPQPLSVLQVYRPIAPWGSSFHNYGAAFDLAILGSPSGMSEYGALAFAGAYAPQLGLRWGGQFSNPDPPHFELSIPLSDAASAWADVTSGATAPPTAPTTDLMLIGLIAATIGAIVWAARRRFASRASQPA
jgi:hypothetical protein